MTTEPRKIDLHTLNEIGPIIDAEIKMRVCEIEQQAQEALEQDYLSYAAQLKHAARSIDLLRYSVSHAITAVFLDALGQQEHLRPAPTANVETVEATKNVELPEIPAKTRTLYVVPNDH